VVCVCVVETNLLSALMLGLGTGDPENSKDSSACKDLKRKKERKHEKKDKVRLGLSLQIACSSLNPAYKGSWTLKKVDDS